MAHEENPPTTLAQKASWWLMIEPPWATGASVLLACVMVWMENAVLSRLETGRCSRVIKVNCHLCSRYKPKKTSHSPLLQETSNKQRPLLIQFKANKWFYWACYSWEGEWVSSHRPLESGPNGVLHRAQKHLFPGPGWGHLRKSHQRRLLPSLRCLRLHPQLCGGRWTWQASRLNIAQLFLNPISSFIPSCPTSFLVDEYIVKCRLILFGWKPQNSVFSPFWDVCMSYYLGVTSWFLLSSLVSDTPQLWGRL